MNRSSSYRVLVAVWCAAAGPACSAQELGSTWTQWGQDATHRGETSAVGQAPTHTLDHLVYDPFEQDELAVSGELTIHYQSPLTDGIGNFYMLHKAGNYTPCSGSTPIGGAGQVIHAPCDLDRGNIVQEIWSETKYHRNSSGGYEQQWSVASDWKPYPLEPWEPMFQPALAGDLLYLPAAGGSVLPIRTSSDTAVPLPRINPFNTIDPNTFVTSGITVDRAGFLYWNVIQLDPVTMHSHGFLIKASPAGQTWKVDYDLLTPGAPAALDMCFQTFRAEVPRPPFPWPPSGDAVPPQAACGRQRPGVNVTPAIGDDGTIFTASTADLVQGYSYIIAVHPDLSLAWATSLRGLVNDGCGVPSTAPEGAVQCNLAYSAPGVDPATNMPPALDVDDFSSSSPVALPDGGVVYGAVDNYNFDRGHMVKLDGDGRFTATYLFGWDSTPAVYQHDGTYSIVIKDNHYDAGGPYFVTQLSADLTIEWQFQNRSTQACSRQPDGSIACTDPSPAGSPPPNGFEWCVNAPAVDADGNVYANDEDGFVYQIGQGGVLKTQTFLGQALGAAYTPISLDPSGHVFALNNGELTVLGSP